MIRYVLAVLLTAAILALGVAAVEYGTTIRGESEVESAVESIEEAAVDLYANADPPPPGGDPPQRLVAVTLPDDSYTSEAAERITFERVADKNLTQATAQFEGRPARVEHIDVPVVGPATTLTGYTGTLTVQLQLVEDDSGPVVEMHLDE